MNEEKKIAAYKAIFPTEHGKVILDDLSFFCLEDRDIFDTKCSRKTDFNLGANSVIRHIRYMLKRKTEQEQRTVIN